MNQSAENKLRHKKNKMHRVINELFNKGYFVEEIAIVVAPNKGSASIGAKYTAVFEAIKQDDDEVEK